MTFLPICNTRCCIRSPAWPTYSTQNGTRVLRVTLGCSISSSGFPWRPGEASGSPGLARSDLAVPNQGLRRGAFATRHKPLDHQSSNELKTCDSRADEISSSHWQPLLLQVGSHDEITMQVHGTSGGRICLLRDVPPKILQHVVCQWQWRCGPSMCMNA